MAGYEEKNVQFRDDDFQLIQADNRIMDTKLDSKPTTFFRDAIRRFRKNKSSVAGFIVLGMAADRAIHSGTWGKERTTSTMRWITVSTQPPK